MLRRTWILLTIGSALALGAADKGGKTAEDAVLAAEKGWAQGVTANDFALLDKVLGDELVYRHSTGAEDTKATYIDKLKTGKARYFECNYDGEPTVKVLTKDTAYVFCRVRVVTLGADGAKSPATLNCLHVYVQRNGQWQLVAHQSSKVN